MTEVLEHRLKILLQKVQELLSDGRKIPLIPMCKKFSLESSAAYT